MNESTRGVTLYAGFILDVLSEYDGMKRLCAPAFALAKGIDPADPAAQVPMKLYNDICDWIEENLGAASIRGAGRAIGRRVYTEMSKQGVITADSGPVAILEALVQAASMMIQDPEGRGWEILERAPRFCRMRRTQTFNCMLQEGLLTSLVQRGPVLRAGVDHERCTRLGDEFCEYRIAWIPS